MYTVISWSGIVFVCLSCLFCDCDTSSIFYFYLFLFCLSSTYLSLSLSLILIHLIPLYRSTYIQSQSHMEKSTKSMTSQYQTAIEETGETNNKIQSSKQFYSIFIDQYQYILPLILPYSGSFFLILNFILEARSTRCCF